MRVKRLLIVGLLMPSLVGAAVAAGPQPVRPSVKAVAPASVAQKLTLPEPRREGAPEDASQLRGGLLLPAIAVAAILIAIFVIDWDGDDDEESPGS